MDHGGAHTESDTKDYAVFKTVDSGPRRPELESHPSHASSYAVWDKSLKSSVPQLSHLRKRHINVT